MTRTALEELREGGDADDAAFDDIFPAWARELSRIHFTPVRAAVRAAAWLAPRDGASVLDVGAGVGKLCLVGALTTGGQFTGVELRSRLVDVATEVARRHGVDRCTFVAGDAFDLDWRRFDGLYLYNPFAELLPDRPLIDDSLLRAAEQFRAQVNAAEARLAAMPAGARLVTFHGFGGLVPEGWNVVSTVRIDDGSLTCWMKTAD